MVRCISIVPLVGRLAWRPSLELLRRKSVPYWAVIKPNFCLLRFFFHLVDFTSETSIFNSSKKMIEALVLECRLAYLHEAIEPKVVHRDIKSSNILIDTEFNAKVSDFGLAKLLGSEKSHVTTRVMGTFGYCFLHFICSFCYYHYYYFFGLGFCSNSWVFVAIASVF